jgi:translation initiation factor 2 alpha subunit (eIF-2alpha)
MITILITVSILVVLSAAVIIYLANLHNGGIVDNNKNFIPDNVEDKAKEIKEEINRRVENVKLEVEDVATAIGNAIDGIDDIPKAAAGAKRKGRPRQ